jgi:peptidoglycan-binding protein ArfA
VPLAGAALVVPTVLAGLTLLWPRPQIEDRLTADATGALAAAGLAADGVVFSGRDATLSGLTGPDARRGVEVVEAVPGVRVAELAVSGDDGTGGPVGGDGTGGPGAVVAGAVGLALRGADLVLSGDVGSEQERTAVVAAATEQAGGRTVVDELTVVPGAALPGGLDAAALGAAAGALAGADGEDLSAAVETGADGAPVVALTGTVPDEAARTAVLDAVDAAVPGATVDDRLTIAAAADPGAGADPSADPSAGADPAAGGDAPAGDLDDAAKAALQGRIDALLAGTPVVFAPDSPELTREGSAALEQVLGLVAAAPGARLQVDGYVATGRGSGRLTAQELSDRRAATVREALVAGGVPADRVTARGLGEGDAPAAEAAGRRVEISVV